MPKPVNTQKTNRAHSIFNMTPYYEDEWATIYHGDCRDVLMEIGTVEVVITDPPDNPEPPEPEGDDQ